MTIEEIKKALIGKTFYYWEIDSGFSTDDSCGVIRDIRSDGEGKLQIVLDKYDFDWLPLSDIERLVKEGKIRKMTPYIYYECEIKNIKEGIKKALRDAYIGKFFVRELRECRGKLIESKEFTVQHLFFGEKEVLFLGDYEHPHGYISLPFRDAVELADDRFIRKILNRGEIIENVYVLKGKEGKL